MRTNHPARIPPALALLAGLALALAPAITPALAATGAQAQGPSQDGQAQGQQDEAGPQNRSDDERGANRSDRGQPNGSQQGERADRRGGDGPPSERGRAPPVDVEDRRGGFATRAPPDSPRPEVAVDARNASATMSRGDVARLDVHLDTIVEFEDADGDGAYDVGEPVVERIVLAQAPSRVEADPANDTRTVVYELAAGEDDPSAGELRLVFDLGTSRAEQVATKFDVVVEGYAFASEYTRIALGSRVQIEGGLERVERDGQPAIAGQRGEQVGYLSWVPTVDVDGTEHPVASSVHVDAEDEADDAIVYWAYPQGERIVHDPEMGVTEAIRDLAGRAMPFALGLAGTLAILGTGYAVRERWGA